MVPRKNLRVQFHLVPISNCDCSFILFLVKLLSAVSPGPIQNLWEQFHLIPSGNQNALSSPPLYVSSPENPRKFLFLVLLRNLQFVSIVDTKILVIQTNDKLALEMQHEKHLLYNITLVYTISYYFQLFKLFIYIADKIKSLRN